MYHKAMAQKADPQSKRSFIQTAQDTTVETNILISLVQQVIDNCSDKRLCIQVYFGITQIKNTSDKITTLAQTLKVIAAVKASSPTDTDKAVQLVTNAQNVVHAVKMVLRDAVSCSLRPKKGCDNMVKFRRAVYAHGFK